MNEVTWKFPPANDHQLQVWKIFVSVNQDLVWEKITYWMKRYGNPYEIPIDENYDAKEQRVLFQLALSYCIK